MCLFPRLVENPKYKITKKNGGNVPVLHDKRIGYVPIGCGKCMECMKKKSSNWKVRLKEEVRNNTNGKFVNLTFSNESFKEIMIKGKIESKGYERDNDIATQAVRWFLERWRKKFKKSVKHWFVTELGSKYTERVHIHGIMWTNESNEEIEKIWGYGNVVIGNEVSERTINYISKYITKVDLKHKYYTPKILTSAGIGKDYINRLDAKGNKYKGEETNEVYKDRSGYKMALPIYYRNYIYTEEEREKLWLHKLDKNERWVGGEKIDVSTDKGIEQYYKLLEYYQNVNKRLGFGNNEIDWEARNYEIQRRNMLMKNNINKVSKATQLTKNPAKAGRSQRKDNKKAVNDGEMRDKIKNNSWSQWKKS